jgi:hypothetical protein
MAVPLYRKACNYGRLLGWCNETMSGAWLFDDFRFDEDLTGNVIFMFGLRKTPIGFGERYWNATRAVKIHGSQELGNEGELMDPPDGFINEWIMVIQDVFAANADRIFAFVAEYMHLPEDAMVTASICRQKLWHAEQIAHANRHLNGDVVLGDDEQW